MDPEFEHLRRCASLSARQTTLRLGSFGGRLVLALDIDHRRQDEGTEPESRTNAA